MENSTIDRRIEIGYDNFLHDETFFTDMRVDVHGNIISIHNCSNNANITNENVTYITFLKKLISEKKTIFEININHMRTQEEYRGSLLEKNATEELKFIENIVNGKCTLYNNNQKYADVKISIIGITKINLAPRELRSIHLNKLVTVKGIVINIRRPDIVIKKCEYYNEEKKISHVFEKYPMTDEINTEQGVLKLEVGLSEFIDYQSFELDNNNQNEQKGLKAKSLTIQVKDKLIDLYINGKLGKILSYTDNVQVMGIYTVKFTPILKERYYLKLLSLVHCSNIHDYDEDLTTVFETLALKENIFEILANSIAPSLEIDSHIKQGILCQLLSGQEVTLKNGSSIRGKIHIMLDGDCSTGKSKLLRNVNILMKNAIFVYSTSTSGIGLTASINISKTGLVNVHPGACIMAHNSILSIDDCELLPRKDVEYLHEVMEQGTVSINKAGVHAQMRASCAIIVTRRIVRCDQLNDNVVRRYNFPDSFISRFDLIYIMIDVKNDCADYIKSERVLDLQKTPYMKEDVLMYNVKQDYNVYNTYYTDPENLVLSYEILTKYIQYAKQKGKQLIIQEEANSIITNKYIQWRLPHRFPPPKRLVNVRTLESMIRLMCAHAKARLSPTVDEIDANMAVKLIEKDLFGPICFIL